jgi:hypothetical protein
VGKEQEPCIDMTTRPQATLAHFQIPTSEGCINKMCRRFVRSPGDQEIRNKHIGTLVPEPAVVAQSKKSKVEAFTSDVRKQPILVTRAT